MSKEELETLDELKNLHSSNYNWNWNTNNPNNPSDIETNHHEMGRSAEGVSLVLSIAFIGFIVFLICLCCPCCLLAKYRKRRGHIYGQAPAPITAQTIQHNGTVIAINSGQRNNPPYPVQHSTVPPHVNPQHPAPYPPYGHGTGGDQSYPRYGPPHNQGQPQMPMPMPMPMHNNDLPPPYPGLPKETMTYTQSANVSQPQPPFNPYFGGETESGQSNPTPYPSSKY